MLILQQPETNTHMLPAHFPNYTIYELRRWRLRCSEHHLGFQIQTLCGTGKINVAIQFLKNYGGLPNMTEVTFRVGGWVPQL